MYRFALQMTGTGIYQALNISRMLRAGDRVLTERSLFLARDVQADVSTVSPYIM
jgi:hypothetical protein